MPIAFNEETGEALRLDAGGSWVPTKIAENPKTGDRLALDGDKWVSVGEKPVNAAEEVGAVGSVIDRTLASVLGAPVDLVNSGLALAQSKAGDAYGVGPLARLLPEPSAAPVGGSEWWQHRMGDVVDVGNAVSGVGGPGGQAVIQAEPKTTTGRVIGRAAGEVASAALPMMGAMRLGAGVARVVPTVGGAVLDSVGGVSGLDRAGQMAVSAGAGLGAGAARELAPNSQVAEFAGGLLGGLGTAGGLGAAGFLTQALAPIVSAGSRRDIAGATLNRFAAGRDPAAGVPSEIIPGSASTTAQATQDSGLAQLERTLRQQPGSAADFVARDTERAAAQRAAMQGLAPEGGGAEEVRGMVRDAYGRLVSAQDEMVRRAQGRVDQRAGALGPGLDPVAAGGTIRHEIGDSTVDVDGVKTPYGARAAAKASEKNLWDRLEQNEDLALEVGAGREAALRIVGKMTPSTQPLSGDAAGVIEAARNMRDVVPWRELQDLRSWAMATGKRMESEGDAVNASRMNAVVRGLDADVARAVGDDAPTPGPKPGGDTSPSAGVIPRSGGPSGGNAVFTPDGQRVETEWRLVDLAGPDAPIVSHTPDFRPNPDYPQNLQPRNRDRAASEAQIVRMAGELNPERLGAGGVGDGAPIIGPDRVTESGNGRLLAIDRAYRNGGRSAEQYRAWIEQQGFDPSGMQRPALVRVRVNELAEPDRVRFTEAANAGPGLKLSPVEQAAIDARRVDDGTLSLYRGGALDDAANVDFARAFVKQAAPGDAGSLSTADGRLSLEGARRMQAAMLAKTYGDAPLVQTLLETGDDDIKALGRALADTAPMMAQLRAAIARGDVPAQFDPVATLTDAARVVQRARKDGVPIGDVLAQTDAFNPVDRNAAAFLSAAYGDGFRRVSYGRAVEALRTYADEAIRQSGGDMFGPGPAAGDVWAAAQRRARGVADDAASDQAKLGGSEAGGGGAGAGAPSGSPAAGAGGGGSGGSGGSSVVGDGLTPNFGPEDAAAYRAARAATAERKGTFDRGAPGQVLRQGGYNARGEAGYAMPVEQVAGRFFNSGKTSATDLAEFLRAAESRPAAVEALRDYAVGDLRRVAVDDAGQINPKKWGAWVAKHDAALKAFPEVRRELSNIGAAQKSVDQLQAMRDARIKGFEKSSAGEFLGDKDADIAFRSVMKSGNRTQGLTQLVRLAGGDADKLGQLRRAAVDDLLRSIENSGAVDGGGQQKLSGSKMIVYMGDFGKPLQKSGLMTPGQIAVLRKVEEDLRREIYVNTVGKAPGSPTYQNFSSAALLGRLALGMEGAQQQGAVANFVSGLLGNTVGRAANFLYQIPDAAVRELLTDAMLDPKLARELMARATPDRMQWILRGVQRRAVATGLITATTADGE